MQGFLVFFEECAGQFFESVISHVAEIASVWAINRDFAKY
jgi:hypothetical protein